MHDQAVPILGELIPIVAIVMGLGLGMLRDYLDFRKKRELFQLYHAERLAAIDKGLELPPLPEEFFRDRRRFEPSPARHRRIGLILLFLGAAITLALWGEGVRRTFLWGLVPVALGLAFLLAAFMEARDQLMARSTSAASAQPALGRGAERN